MKWKMIINEAENPDNDKYGFAEITHDSAEVKILEESMTITSGSDVSPHKGTTKIAEPQPEILGNPQLMPGKGYILSQQYQSPANNKDYIAVGPENVEKELYRNMVQKAIKLKNDFRGVKGMVSRVQICIIQEGEPLEDAKYETVKGRTVLTTNAPFVGGADGGRFDESIMELIDSLESRTMAIGTAIGVDQKEYSRAKLKLIGNRFQEEIIHNMSAIGLKNIGTEKNNTKGYIITSHKLHKDHRRSLRSLGRDPVASYW
jgi:hypothetical protein